MKKNTTKANKATNFKSIYRIAMTFVLVISVSSLTSCATTSSKWSSVLKDSPRQLKASQKALAKALRSASAKTKKSTGK